MQQIKKYLLMKFIRAFCSIVFIAIFLMGCGTKPPVSEGNTPWQIIDKSSLVTTFITTVDFPSAHDEERTLGRIFYDIEREQLFVHAPVLKLHPPGTIPRVVVGSSRHEYYYVDTDNKTVEKSAPNEDVVEIFRFSELLSIDRLSKTTETYKQPFGNFELISSNNRTFALFPRLVWNWPPGTGTSWERGHNGTMKIELKGSDKTDFIFSISEKYEARSGEYSATFTPDGLYAIILPSKLELTKPDLIMDHLMVIGKLPVNKSKSEIKAIVKEQILERKELELPFSL